MEYDKRFKKQNSTGLLNNVQITFLHFESNLYDKNRINYLHIIQSLSYFEDAEDENLPKVFIDYNWETIKNYYIKEQEKIYNESC